MIQACKAPSILECVIVSKQLVVSDKVRPRPVFVSGHSRVRTSGGNGNIQHFNDYILVYTQRVWSAVMSLDHYFQIRYDPIITLDPVGSGDVTAAT
jgi:hypothetical protein